MDSLCHYYTITFGITAVVIKFNVKWDDSATTVPPTVPPKPDVNDKTKSESSEGNEKDHTVTIVVVIVVVLVVIIVVVIVVIIIKKKKQSGKSAIHIPCEVASLNY